MTKDEAKKAFDDYLYSQAKQFCEAAGLTQEQSMEIMASAFLDVGSFLVAARCVFAGVDASGAARAIACHVEESIKRHGREFKDQVMDSLSREDQ